MFSVRYFSRFQHAFGRPGHEATTEVFRRLMEEEDLHLPGEDILVSGIADDILGCNDNCRYPILIGDATTDDYEIAKELWIEENNLAPLDRTLPT